MQAPTAEECRQLLRPERVVVGGLTWYIWRDAEGRQIHAGMDPRNVPMSVRIEALRQSGLCLSCDADGCPGPGTKAWCLEAEQ